MLNCNWAKSLTHYDCRQVDDLYGERALEIGTPFSLHDGSAIVLYVAQHGDHVLISDNGDTLMHLSGAGLDVWHHTRQKAIRDRAAPHGVTLNDSGDLRCLAQAGQAPFAFARAITGVLAVANWACEQAKEAPVAHNLAAEAEPYIIARNPDWRFERRMHVLGASRTDYVFDFLHGPDLIDVIGPTGQATGWAMRKVGDVQNGPFADGMLPLVIVDDRSVPILAAQEISILGSITRAMPLSELMRATSH